MTVKKKSCADKTKHGVSIILSHAAFKRLRLSAAPQHSHTAICISSNKGKTIIAILMQFYQPFLFSRFPLHSPLPEPLIFSLFNLVELFLCIIDPQLLQIFSSRHSIHRKAFPVMLVHLFQRTSIGEQPLLAFSEACFLSLSLRQFLSLPFAESPGFFADDFGLRFFGAVSS